MQNRYRIHINPETVKKKPLSADRDVREANRRGTEHPLLANGCRVDAARMGRLTSSGKSLLSCFLLLRSFPTDSH